MSIHGMNLRFYSILHDSTVVVVVVCVPCDPTAVRKNKETSILLPRHGQMIVVFFRNVIVKLGMNRHIRKTGACQTNKRNYSR